MPKFNDFDLDVQKVNMDGEDNQIMLINTSRELISICYCPERPRFTIYKDECL